MNMPFEAQAKWINKGAFIIHDWGGGNKGGLIFNGLKLKGIVCFYV